MTAQLVRVPRQDLTRFCREIFQALGVPLAEALISAEVLVAADAMGILSHGTGRLGRYVNGLTTGQILPAADLETVADTATSLVLDAHGGLGAPASAQAMARVIAKARLSGMALASVRDSNHFGIASHWARVSHFFGAIRIDRFRDPEEFRLDMDRMLRALRQAPRAEDEERIYYAGLPEREAEEESARLGVPILGKTWEALGELGKAWKVDAPIAASAF